MQPLTKFFCGLFLLLSACTIVGVGDSDMSMEKRKESIHKSILSHAKELRGCYDSLLTGPMPPQGTVVMQFNIDQGGNAQNVSVDNPNSTLKDDDLWKCLIDIVKKLKFPKTPAGKDMHIKFPFKFSKELE